MTSVLVAYLHPNTVSHNFSDSLMRLFAHDLSHEQRVLRGGGPAMFRCGPGGLVEARNDVVRHFLDESPAEWLWFVDSDMGFAPDTVDRLLGVADPVERPVVGALCFGQREESPDGLQGWSTRMFPTLYDWARKPDGEVGFRIRRDYPVNSVVRVAGTGAACLLVHRSVCERIRAGEGDEWFTRKRYPSGQLIAEDLSFCARVNGLGLPVLVNTAVRTNHHKPVWLSEGDYWRQVVPPPATEQTAVIVPVMRRPQNARPFMASLRASTGLATVYAVTDPADVETVAAWRAAAADVLLTDAEELGGSAAECSSCGRPLSPDHDADAPGPTVRHPFMPVTTSGPGTFAEKVNLGYRQTSEPWLFLVGDDVRFHPGWLDHAQHVARSTGARVVGTNDLGTPRVQAGEHATHLLVSRAYVDEHGASWDGPKVVAHEGYGHWFVDDELVTVAKQRGVWAAALGSVVEHLHPLFGKGDPDEVYELGGSHAEADREVFEQRCRMYLSKTA